LTSIARNPPSPFRKLILQLLLLSGLEVKTLDIIHLELVREYSDMVSQVVIDMLKKWGWEEREKGISLFDDVRALRRILKVLSE